MLSGRHYHHLSSVCIFILLYTERGTRSAPRRIWLFALQSLTLTSGNFMVVAEDSRALRMAEDGCADADLPDCNCDVTRQASP